MFNSLMRNNATVIDWFRSDYQINRRTAIQSVKYLSPQVVDLQMSGVNRLKSNPVKNKYVIVASIDKLGALKDSFSQN